jgi:hypothetical protein
LHSTIFYGQIDVFIAFAVIYDLSMPDTSRTKGAAIGLAAAFKLTPAFFAVYLVLTRRYRAAATAAAVFFSTVVLGFLVVPADSFSYWDIFFLRPGRISPPSDPQNQSLLGAISRIFHTGHPELLWLGLAGLVMLTGMALAAWVGRRGDEVRGFTLCGITELLISPISWTHHWVIGVPALFLATLAIYRNWPHLRFASLLGAIAVTAITVIGWSQMARSVPSTGWLQLSTSAEIKSDLYVIIGLGVLMAAVSTEFIRYSRAAQPRRQRPARLLPYSGMLTAASASSDVRTLVSTPTEIRSGGHPCGDGPSESPAPQKSGR